MLEKGNGGYGLRARESPHGDVDGEKVRAGRAATGRKPRF